MAAASFFGWGCWWRRRGLGHPDRSPQLPTLAVTHHHPSRQPRGRNLAPGRVITVRGRCWHPAPGDAAAGCYLGLQVQGGGREAAVVVVMAGSPALPSL